jgi:SAM-dependent methyltransferase
VDIDHNAVALGIARGRRLRPGTIAECAGLYDLVFCNHVFEHIQDPDDFLRTVHARLVPGGVFAAAMPHVGLEARVRGREWIGWSPNEHYWLYSTRGLRQLLQRCGFEVAALDVRNGVAGESLRQNLTSPSVLGRYALRKVLRAAATATASGCQLFALARRRG